METYIGPLGLPQLDAQASKIMYVIDIIMSTVMDTQYKQETDLCHFEP